MMYEKTLWQRYGKLALLSILLLLGASIAFQVWNHKNVTQAEQASVVYEKMLTQFKQNDMAATEAQANILIKQYQKTPYSALAALMLSRVALDQNNSTQAIEMLNLAVSLGKQGPLEDVARIRLARVLINEARYHEALAVLPEESKKTAYTSLFQEIRGDIYFHQNEPKKAKEAYAKAMKAAPEGAPMTSLQLKYTDLNVKEES